MIAPFGLSWRIIMVTLCSAAVAAGIAWLSVQADHAPEPSPAGASVVATRSYLFSSDAILAGARLSDDLFKSVEMRPDQAGANLLLDSAQNRAALTQLAAHRPIPMGTPFLTSDLEAIEPEVPAVISQQSAAPQTHDPVPSARPGMQAIAVAITSEVALAGLVSRGDRIDVLVSYAQDRGIRAVRTVLRNVRVLQTDQSNSSVAGAAAAKTVTLEVTPEGAKILALAKHAGDLVLVLSAPSDDDMPSVADDEPVLSSRIIGEPLSTEHNGGSNVRIIRGGASTRQWKNTGHQTDDDPPLTLN